MWRSLRKNLPDIDKDDLLDMVGLETRGDRMLPSLALFGAGVLLGVGLGMMLAPKPGRELREDLRERLGKGPNGAPAPKPTAPDTALPRTV